MTAVALALPSVAEDIPDRLFTTQGVELRADEDVFVLFAALNAAGYAEETKRKGPPLRAPVFHPIRRTVRDALRKFGSRPSVVAMTTLFEDHAEELEDYLAAALGAGGLSPAAQRLQRKLAPALERFRKDAKVVQLFDDLAAEQRAHAQRLRAGLDRDLSEAAKQLGDDAFRAPKNLVVVPNPLEAHALIRRVQTQNEVLLITGPDDQTARQAVLEAALKPALRRAVDKHYRSARLFARSWASLKTNRRIARRYIDGRNYLAEALARALAFRVIARREGRAGKDADEAF
ncbi:MAG: hypothetical protein AAFV29_21030, partial [Myxococcota bacterium]